MARDLKGPAPFRNESLVALYRREAEVIVPASFGDGMGNSADWIWSLGNCRGLNMPMVSVSVPLRGFRRIRSLVGEGRTIQSRSLRETRVPGVKFSSLVFISLGLLW